MCGMTVLIEVRYFYLEVKTFLFNVICMSFTLLSLTVSRKELTAFDERQKDEFLERK